MALDDLLNSEHNGLLCGDTHQLGDQQGDWTRPPGSGSDQELQRSQTAVALNELLRQHGMDEVGVDSLLLNDNSLHQLPRAAELPPLANLAELSPSRSLIVLDQGVANWRDLLVDAPADAEVLLLDRSRSGVEQISDFLLQERLSGARRFDTLAIVSEGADGRLLLGNGELSAVTLNSQKDLLRSWGDALSAGADLLLFGCNVAASAGGAAFVRNLASLTGTDVAASSDCTGAAELGGDLQLEDVVGGVASQLPSELEWLEGGITRLGQVLDAEAMAQPLPQLTAVGEERLSDALVLATLQQALAEANQILSDLPERADYGTLLQDAFGNAGTDTASFDGNRQALAEQLNGSGLNLTVDLRSAEELNGAAGAYASVGHTGSERIYLNADWLASGVSASMIRQVLLEEAGHAIDRRLNSSFDARGDEGQLFAELLTGERLSVEERAAISSENDQSALLIEGIEIVIEQAITGDSLVSVPAPQSPIEDTNFNFSSANANAISIANSSVETITVTLSVAHGLLTLAASTASSLSFSQGDGTSDSTMTFTGTRANVNAALEGLLYRSTPDYYGEDQLVILSSTSINGQTKAETTSVLLNVSPVSDAPTAAASTRTLPEGSPYTFSAADFGFSDAIDAGSDQDSLLRIEIVSLPEGFLFYDNSARPLFASLRRPYLILAADIPKLRYQPAAGWYGQDSFRYRVIDTGSNGPTTSATVGLNFTITAVNDPPIILPNGSSSSNTVAYLENASALLLAPGLTLYDPDAQEDQVTSATVAIASPLAGDVLTWATPLPNGISTTGFANGTVVFTGTTSRAAYESLLRSVAYSSASDDPTALASRLTRTVTWTVVDNNFNQRGAGPLAGTGTTTINIMDANDPPVITEAGGTLAYAKNDGPVAVDTSLTITDVDDSNIESATIAIVTGYVSTEDVLAFVNTPSISGSWNAATGVLTLTGSASKAAYELALESVTYQNTSLNPTTAERTVSWSVSDGDASSLAVTSRITIAQRVNEDSDLVFSTVNDNAISVAAIDAATIQVTLTSTNGLLTLSERSGLSFSSGTGTAESTMTFSGSKDAVNAALNGLIYRANANYNGSAQLSITTSYLDATGSGVTLTDTVTIDVTPVSDAPTGTDNTVTVLEDGTKTFAPADFGFADATDTGSDVDTLSAVRIAALPANGTLNYNGTPITQAQITAGFDVTLADLSAGKLTYAPAANAYGSSYASFTFQVIDTGSTANGGVVMDATPNTISIDVTPVSDAPTGTDNTVTVLEDGTKTFAPADFGFADATDTGSDVDTLSAVRIAALPANGTLNYNGTPITQAQITAGFDVTLADLSAGKLTYAPAANAYGSSYASFTFQVIDTGSTANGGVVMDATPNTISITVTAVDDQVTDADETVTFAEDSSANSGNLLTNASSLDGPVSIATFSIAGESGPFSLGIPYTVSGKGSITINADGSYSFTPAPNFNGTFPVLTYAVTDGSGTADFSTLAITITAVDDQVTDADETVTFAEDSSANSGNLLTNASSLDGPVSIATFSIAGESGPFSLGIPYTVSGKGSITINADGSYSFTPAPNFNGTFPVLTYAVTDGSGTADFSTLAITVTAVDDAPVATGSATLTAINEDTSNPAGDTVATLFTANFSDATDAVTGGSTANTLAGIAITANAASAAQGTWQWSTDGITWNAIATTGLSNDSALFLASNTTLRFLPSANFNGTPGSLTTRLVDSSATFTNGTTVDADPNGNTTAFSPGTVALGTSITAVNDAPVATGSATLTAINEDTSNPAGDTVATLFTANFSDATDAVTGGSTANTLAGIAITANAASAAQGTWQWSTDGITWNAIATTGLSNDSALFLASNTTLRFLPSANFNGTPGSLTTRLVDSSATFTNGTTVDADPNGNTTAFSPGTVALGTSVTAINDPPVLDLSAVATGTGYATAFIASGPAVALVAADALITDIDDEMIDSATIDISNPLGDILQAGLLPTGISATQTTPNTIILSGAASKAQYAVALQAVSFTTTSLDPRNRTIDFTIYDGEAISNKASTTLQLISVQGLTTSNAKTVEGNTLDFSVTLSAASNTTPISLPLSVDPGSTATAGSDYNQVPKIYRTDGIEISGAYNAATGLITIPAGVREFIVRYSTTDDLVVEGTETLLLSIGGLSATGQITDGAGSSLRVNKITVNEGSPTAVFRVDGVEGQAIQLSLAAYTNDAEVPQATTDFTAGAKAAELSGTGSASDAGPDIASKLQIYDGKTWKDYINGSFVKYPTGSTTLLVRVPINNDLPYEAREAFKLVATGRAIDSLASDDTSSISATGIGIIADDARGSIFNESGAENYRALKDDDRDLKVSSININEGSTYGVFTITQSSGSTVTLNLELTDSDQRTFVPTETTFDMNQTLEVWDPAANKWVNYSGSVSVISSVPLYVRVNTSSEQDNVFEGQVGSTSKGETFQLKATNTGTSDTFFGIGQILDDGTGVKYTGDIGNDGPVTSTEDLDDDLDKDGIAPNVEEQLATLSASSGGGGKNGDLNNDGIQDAEQPAVATLAWIQAENFQDALAGDLTDSKPIIYISVETDTDPTTTSRSGEADTKYQLQKVSVVQQEDARFGGNLPTQSSSANIQITSIWDPIVFSVAKLGTSLDDADPTRSGVQVAVTIDISRAGVKEGDFNGYRKYVSQKAIDEANSISKIIHDLDGKPITTAGWYDFLQRQGPSGNYIGDGARFIVESINGERRITKIQLTYTDNEFGDNNVLADGIEDPGLPVLIKVITPATTTTTTTGTGTGTTVEPETISIPEIPEQKTTQRSLDNNNADSFSSTNTNSSDDDPYIRGSGGSEQNLVEAFALTAQDTINSWADKAGLTNNTTDAVDDSQPAPVNESSGNADTRGNPLAFVSEAMGVQPGLGGNLLEALVLGGGSLYAFNRLSGGALSNWVKQLLPKAPGPFVAGAVYERVVVVFLMEAEVGLQRLVAAEVNDERIEILAEQILPMTLSAAAAPGSADLEHHLQQLVKKVTDQANSEHDLLLFDPKIEKDLPTYQQLGRDNEKLQPQRLRAVLGTLNTEEVAALHRWINKPSSTALRDHPLSKRLNQRQQQLQNKLNEPKARLVSLLELSLAMTLKLA